MQDVVAELEADGFTVIRGFLSPSEPAQLSMETHRIYQEGLKHHATYRDKNLLFEVLNDPKAGRRVVLQAHWTAWISPLMERMSTFRAYGQRPIGHPRLGFSGQLCFGLRRSRDPPG
jgi:hypothetical protein